MTLLRTLAASSLPLLIGATLHAGMLPPVERITLDNGLRALVVTGGDASAAATLTLVVDAGWARDPAAALGTAEMVVGAIAEGSHSHTAQAVREELLALGATLTQQVARDYAAVTLRLGDAPALARATALLAELAAGPALSRYSLDRIAGEMTTAQLALGGDADALGRRQLAVLAWGPSQPFAGWPDPWQLRSAVAAAATAFHRRHWRPDRSVLVLVGVDPGAARTALAESFARWINPPEPPAPLPAPPGPQPRASVGLVAAPAMPNLYVGLLPEGSLGTTPIERYVVAALAADLLGETASAGSPLPYSGFETLRLAEVSSVPEALARTGRAFEQLAKDPARLDAIRDSLLPRFARSLADPDFVPLWLAQHELLGADADPGATLAHLDRARVKSIAGSLARGERRPAVVVGPRRLLNDIRRVAAAAEELEPFAGADAEAGRVAARGREVLAAAIAAQGGLERLRQIAHIDERSLGEFVSDHDVRSDIRLRRLTSPPDRAYVEADMYRAGYMLVHRIDGEQVSVVRSKLGASPGSPVLGRVILRQALRHPALALVRPHDLGLVRFVGHETQDGIPHDVLEVLDPAVGVARYWIRTRDGALTRLRFDLSPLDDSIEEHAFEDFADAEGVRVPFSERAIASGKPLFEMCHNAVSFPDWIDPAAYRLPLLPSAVASVPSTENPDAAGNP